MSGVSRSSMRSTKSSAKSKAPRKHAGKAAGAGFRSEFVDRLFMREALELAARARGRTSPNPMVGCVIVRDGAILSSGYHEKAGRDHAEVVALKKLVARGVSASGATAYVTLEPCDHVGRTGKCTEALIAAGIAKVICAMRDPNPLVSGRGLRHLKKAGIATEVGVLEDEARKLNRVYIKWITTGHPLVTIKAAVSLDGRIAAEGGDSRWISGETSRTRAHHLRDQSDAILVGAGTVAKDDPQLTARIPGGQNPLRVVVDGALTISPRAKAVPGALVITSTSAAADRVRKLERAGAQVLRLPAKRGRIPMAAILDALGKRNVTSLLVEGGSEILGQFLPHADRLVLFIAPKILGSNGVPLFSIRGPARVKDAIALDEVEISRMGVDLCIEGMVRV